MVVPVVITVVVLVVFFRDISFGAIKANFLRIPGGYLAAFLVLSMAATLLRAWKYYILLSGRIGFKDIFLITLVRNFSVDLLPARTGALLLFMADQKKGIDLEEGASSFVVSVFYDGLALAFMLGGLLFFLETGSQRTPIYIGMAIIFVISIAMIFFAEIVLGFVLGWRMMKRFPRLMDSGEKIRRYLAGHRGNGERLTLLGLSLLIRLLKYVFIFILFEGVVRVGFRLETFSLFSFGLAGTELSSLIPIQGIGGFGTWELAFVYIFKALEIPAANIREAGFVIHITTQVWEYFIGLLAFIYLVVGTKRSEAKQ